MKPDQTGFINGRHGTDNVRRVLNIQMIAGRRQVPSMLLSLDAEKAFDRLDWEYLKQTLVHMGFHDIFIRWIQIFYYNPKSRVRVNGYCSEFFDLRRGTRQGDAIFALNHWPRVLYKVQSPNTRNIGRRKKLSQDCIVCR